MVERQVIFRVHAVFRMIQRQVNEGEVLAIVEQGEVIETYPDDFPYPSELLLGWAGGRPLHVVVGYHSTMPVTYVIAVYEPDEKEWESDLRRRKP